MKEKHKLIKRLLLEGKTLEEIRIEAHTSWRTIYKVIEDNGLQEYRSKVKREYKAKNAVKMNTPQAKENKRQTIINRRNEKSLFGNKAKEHLIKQSTITAVNQRSELYFAFMEEYNALMGESEHQILKEEVVVLLAKYSG